MKREILFRGKRKKDGEWIHGLLTKDKLGHYRIQFDVNYFTSVVDPETVGQFTGLTDKNGTKIFEGDIVKFYDDSEDEFVNGIIICNADFCSFCVSMKKHEDIILMAHWQYEVIGNVHDNSELLK